MVKGLRTGYRRRKEKMNLRLKEMSIESYKSIIENNPDAIFILSADGTIVEVNQMSTQMIGYSKEELQGRHYEEFVVPAFKEFTDLQFQSALQGNSPEYKTQCFQKNGEIIYLQIKHIPLWDNGKIVGIFCVGKDLTELYKTKSSLSEIEERLKALFNSTGDANYILDLLDNVINVNPAFEEIYGCQREELVGKRLPIIPEYRQLEEMLAKTKRGEHIQAVETVCINNAEIATVSINNEGNPADLSVFSEITDRKMTEKSEERYRLIVENMRDLICIIDKVGYFKYSSPSYEWVFGFPPETYEGSLIFNWMHKEDIPLFKKHKKEMLLTKRNYFFQFRFKNIKGDWVWLEANCTPIYDEKGEFKHFLVVSREITERRMYEEILKHMAYHDPLTGIPNSRLFKERLEQSLKEAKRYNRKMAIIYMDLDKLKEINDTLGHDAGDELLKQFAKRVQGCIRESDTLARQGGDEFTLIMPEIQAEQDAANLANRIIDVLQQPWHIGEHTFHTTASIGIAFYPADGTNIHELMKHADEALYKAKKSGRNNYKSY
jgi:diguanylate cyclase (GGDEF)-like protein/PAS domain S-box-containing protein